MTAVLPAGRALPEVHGWRQWPWRPILFLHGIFLLANVSLDSIPFPTEEAATVDRLVSASDEGMLGRRIAFTVLGMVAMYALWKFDYRRFRVKGFLGVLMLAFFVWSCMSLGWAEDVPLAARKVLIFVLLWLGAAWAAFRLSPGNLLRFGFLSNFLTLGTCLGIEVAFGRFRPWIGGYRFAGLYHPNETGQCLVVATLAALALATWADRLSDRVRYVAAACVSFAFLLMTGSRTSLLSAGCAILSYWFVLALGSRRPARGAIVAVGIVVGAICVGYLLVGPHLSRALTSAFTLWREDSDISTLTLRTPLWHVLIDRYISARPFLGYGYGAFWSTKHVIAMSLLRKGTVYFHSHSGYLEMALSIGVIGAAVHVLTLLLGVRILARDSVTTDDRGNAFGAALLITLLLSMFTEPTNMSAYLMPTFLDMAFLMHCAFVIRAGDTVPERVPVLGMRPSSLVPSL